ncbi:hypothetical protein D3C78_437840 [compost metagenome]
MKIKRNLTCFFVVCAFAFLSCLLLQPSPLTPAVNQSAANLQMEALQHPVFIAVWQGWPSSF